MLECEVACMYECMCNYTCTNSKCVPSCKCK